MAFWAIAIAAPQAHAETRTLKLYYTHTKERATITFKRNGKYDQKGLREINRFLRDWRRNEATEMDPQLLDIVWEAYQAVGARDYIHVVSAYRSPATNAMLRRTRGGQATKSQHMLGKALDFYIPGVPIKKLREVGFKLQGGGVGYYPKSGVPFVHLDTGNVRAWPRMSRSELSRIFPNGGTLHLPPDGNPLPGYQQALADYKARKARGQATVNKGSSGGPRRSGNLLAALFGGGADEDEDVAETIVATQPSQRPQPAAQAPAPAPAPVQTPETLLAALPTSQMPLPTAAPRAVGAGVPVVVTPPTVAAPQAQTPAPQVPAPQQAEPAPVAEALLASLPASALPRPVARPSVLLARVDDSGQERRNAAEIEAALAAANNPENALRPTVDDSAASQQRDALIAALQDGASTNGARAVNALVGLPGTVPTRPETLPSTAVAYAPPTPAPALDAQARSELERAVVDKGGRLPVPAQRAREDIQVAALPDDPVFTTTKNARPDPSLVGRSTAPQRPVVTLAAIDPQSVPATVTAPVPVSAIGPSTRPDFIKNAQRAAPDMVYAQGFSTAPPPTATDRFSGNAVTFLAVAKFEGGNGGGGQPLQIQIPATN